MRTLTTCIRHAMVIAIFALGVGCGTEDPEPDTAVGFTLTAGTAINCVQLSVGRPGNRQSVSATLDAASAPSDIRVLRGPRGSVEHIAATATFVAGYQDGLYERLYQLLAWNIGSEGNNDYILLLPASVATSPFAAQLHVYFEHGAYGWWQKALSCSLE